MDLGFVAEPVGLVLELPPAIAGSLGTRTEKTDSWLSSGLEIGKINVAENQGVRGCEDVENLL